MKKIVFLSIIQLMAACAAGASDIRHKNDSLMRVLDHVIDRQADYYREKDNRILQIQRNCDMATTDSGQYQALKELFAECKNYSMDRSCLIADRARLAADCIGADSLIWQAMLMQAEAEKGIGRYQESIQILDSLPKDAYELYGTDIISRYCSAYYSLEENALPRSNAKKYKEKLIAYRDTLARKAPTPSDRIVNLMEYYKLIGENKMSLQAYRNYIQQYPEDTASRHMLDYVAGEAHLALGDYDVAKYYMLQTAIKDLRLSVRKYNALPTVARLLYREGDYEHAYKYIMHSLFAVRESQAQSRMLRIMDALPIITASYNTQKVEESRTRSVLLALSTFLACVVIVMLLLAYNRNTKLRREHTMVDKKNQELIELNRKVEDLNRQLRESIRDKEDYIGDLFNLCSEYINIMSRHNASAIKLLKSGAPAKDIEKQLTEIQNGYQLTSFFDKFDKILLSIFPDFVQKVNALLQEDYRVSPAPGQLTPELRIFALIRLGFNDTGKIARFLHFSPQTVYNYRFRARNHALCDKDEFIKSVRTL